MALGRSGRRRTSGLSATHVYRGPMSRDGARKNEDDEILTPTASCGRGSASDYSRCRAVTKGSGLLEKFSSRSSMRTPHLLSRKPDGVIVKIACRQPTRKISAATAPGDPAEPRRSKLIRSKTLSDSVMTTTATPANVLMIRAQTIEVTCIDQPGPVQRIVLLPDCYRISSLKITLSGWLWRH